MESVAGDIIFHSLGNKEGVPFPDRGPARGVSADAVVGAVLNHRADQAGRP